MQEKLTWPILPGAVAVTAETQWAERSVRERIVLK